MAPKAIAGFFILAIACGVGFSVASADSTDDLTRAGAFGFDEATHVATLATASSLEEAVEADIGTSGQVMLERVSTRDINAGLTMVATAEANAEARAAAENEAALSRVEEKKAQQGVGPQTASSDAKGAEEFAATPDGTDGDAPQEANPGDLDEYNLPAVDWSVGKKAFLAEWAQRIDAYLDKTPLEGYGDIFAEAAWENGVDPRWSPAISNTESGNGTHCFLPHNAWGWGDDAWPNWETAIRAHVKGLADGYGYSLTFEAAQQYCPPNCIHWYNNTLGQMNLI
jgi:hypothetical protein